MEGYTKRAPENTPKEDLPHNVIKVKAKGQIKNNLGYALSLFTKDNETKIEIRGTGNAIVKALILIELVKRRLGDLHQVNEITSTEIVDIYDPEIEGLEVIEQKRRVTCLHCILSKEPLDQNHIGYQPPQPKEEKTPNDERERAPRQNNNRPQKRFKDDYEGPRKEKSHKDGAGRGGQRNNEDRQDDRRPHRGGRGGRGSGGIPRSGSADNRKGGRGRGGYHNENRRTNYNDHILGQRDETRGHSPRGGDNFPPRNERKGQHRFNDQTTPFRGGDRQHQNREHYPRQNQGGYYNRDRDHDFEEDHPRGPPRQGGNDFGNDRPFRGERGGRGGFRGRRPSFDDNYLHQRGGFRGGRGGFRGGRDGDFNDRPPRDFDGDDRNERRGPPMRRGGYGSNFDGPREQHHRFNRDDRTYDPYNEPDFNDGPTGGDRPLRGRGRGFNNDGGERPFRGRGGFRGGRGGRGGHNDDHHEGGERPFRGRGGFRGGRGGAPRHNDLD